MSDDERITRLHQLVHDIIRVQLGKDEHGFALERLTFEQKRQELGGNFYTITVHDTPRWALEKKKRKLAESLALLPPGELRDIFHERWCAVLGEIGTVDWQLCIMNQQDIDEALQKRKKIMDGEIDEVMSALDRMMGNMRKVAWT